MRLPAPTPAVVAESWSATVARELLVLPVSPKMQTGPTEMSEVPAESDVGLVIDYGSVSEVLDRIVIANGETEG
jgi:hydroxyethylthiazole kinase-like sugar kinase family protein